MPRLRRWTAEARCGSGFRYYRQTADAVLMPSSTLRGSKDCRLWAVVVEPDRLSPRSLRSRPSPHPSRRGYGLEALVPSYWISKRRLQTKPLSCYYRWEWRVEAASIPESHLVCRPPANMQGMNIIAPECYSVNPLFFSGICRRQPGAGND